MWQETTHYYIYLHHKQILVIHHKSTRKRVAQPLAQTLTTFSQPSHIQQTLLRTVELYVLDKQGNKHIARAVIDSASQSNFITQELVDKLQLPKQDINFAVSDINQKMLSIKHLSSLSFISKYHNYKFDLSCLLLNKISDNLPHLSFLNKQIQIPNHIPLADERFNEYRPIDILLGADIFWDLFLEGQIKTTKRGPVIQNT